MERHDRSLFGADVYTLVTSLGLDFGERGQRDTDVAGSETAAGPSKEGVLRYGRARGNSSTAILESVFRPRNAGLGIRGLVAA